MEFLFALNCDVHTLLCYCICIYLLLHDVFMYVCTTHICNIIGEGGRKRGREGEREGGRNGLGRGG